jgi:hypothetical protein
MSKFFKATVDHYEAKRSEALAILDVYFNHSVGIGEHSDLMEEIRKWTETLDEADSVLDTMARNFTVVDGQVETQNGETKIAKTV